MRLALLAFALVALLASPALGAEAKLLVAGESFPEARVRFDLDATWQQRRGEMAGTPMIGSYDYEAPGRAQDEHCALHLTVVGLSVRRRQRPVLRNGVLTLQPKSWWGLNRVRVAHRDRRGPTWLYRTRLTDRASGVAVLPTPRWIRPIRPVTVVRFEIASSLDVLGPRPDGGYQRVEPSAEQRAFCDAFVQQHLGPALRQALRSVRIERRP